MSISTARIQAIFRKEIQDLKTNMNVLYMYAIPIVLVIIYQRLIPNLPSSFVIGFGLLFLVTMIGMYVPAMIIAEEKEKNTLEVLMLSPASPLEVFIGKGLMTFLSIHIVLVILLLVSGVGVNYLGAIIVGTMLTSIVSILIGMIVGLVVETQMQTGVVGTPIYMLLMLVPLLADLTEGGFILVLAKFLPTYYYFDMINLAAEQNVTLYELGTHIGFLILSMVIALALLLTVYKRKGLE